MIGLRKHRARIAALSIARTLWQTFLVAAMLHGVACAAASAADDRNVDVVAPDPPPPPRFESLPRMRSGQVWVPGHWRWQQQRYDWLPGYWQPERSDQRFVPGRWTPVRDGNGWQWQAEHWARLDRARDRERDRDAKRWRSRETHDGGSETCLPAQVRQGIC